MDAVRFVVKDVFKVTGRGIVLVGGLESGTITVGAELSLVGQGRRLPITIIGIENFRHSRAAPSASLPQGYGLMVRGVQRDQVAAGDIVTNG